MKRKNSESALYPEFEQLNMPAIEKEILQWWKENRVFERSVNERPESNRFVFYEGPPSANGKPGIHHVMSRTIKDLFCRFKTLQGYRVERKAGWDTHGLPVELNVEKTLGITKADIGTKITVAEYNKLCREDVMRYTDVWNDLTEKMGYWVDLDNPYITYENNYIETLWAILKMLFDKGLLYEGYTIQPYSPAAGTGLSSHELNQPGCYRNVKDVSAIAQFKSQDARFKSQGIDSVYFLAWTTTPWTLPSNTALAVGKEIEYVLVKTFNQFTHQLVHVILAKDLFGKYFAAENAELSFDAYKKGDKKIPFAVLQSFKGSELEGIRYEQLLPYAQPSDGDAFRVVLGDFVTTTDGTGIVHIAPSFGADDFKVAKQNGIGSLTLVDRSGKFVDAVSDPVFPLDGRYVKEAYYTDAEKEQEFHLQKEILRVNNVIADLKSFMTADDLIVLKLKLENKLFKTEKYEHNYPHCWRTDKPVIYYPLDSWFIRTTAIKDKLVALNKTINWKPVHTGEGRFGQWLENLVDWNLSRSRYWGTPLPIWTTDDRSEIKCIGSLEQLLVEIQKAIDRNVDGISNELKVKISVQQGVHSLRKAFFENVDVENAMHRTELGQVSFKLGETGDATKNFKGGWGLNHIVAKRNDENLNGFDVVLKLLEVIAVGQIEKEVTSKQTIHISHDGYEAVLSKDFNGGKEVWLLTGWEKYKPGVVEEFCPTYHTTHRSPAFSREAMVAGLSDTKVAKILPNYQLDLHKPFVDEIVLVSELGKPMHRVPDLIDVWFDSGAMPYAQYHWPFENQDKVGTLDANGNLVPGPFFPAGFIAEGVDQTRGWFFTLHVLATALTDGKFPAYKTVVSNGLLLDKNGNKMSKRLGNVIDPFETLEKYSADATRWYMMRNSDPWDNMKFDIGGLQEVQRSHFGTLYNTYGFFALYANIDKWGINKSNLVAVEKRPELDRWILSKLQSLIKEVTAQYEDYEPTKAARATEQFVDEDLSNWYVRLNRRRFWKGEMSEDKKAAYETLFDCLNVVAQLMAPVAPFFSDWLFANLNGKNESIHLSHLIKANESLIDKDLEQRMELAQKSCSLILSLRKKEKIKVRQPLSKILIPVLSEAQQMQFEKVESYILNEVNVKSIEYISDASGVVKKKIKPNFKELGKRAGQKIKAVQSAVAAFGQAEISSIEKEHKYVLNLDGENFELLLGDVEIQTEDIPGWLVVSDAGLTVALDVTITDDLRKEGNAREFINKVQNLRKDKDFQVLDRIRVSVVKNATFEEALVQFKEYIGSEILAKDIAVVETLDVADEIEMNEELLKVKVEVVS
jgi:isoleucyl-tRNA synthetase